MTAIASRIAKLENRIGVSSGERRVLMVGSGGASDSEIDAFLRDQDFEVDARDLVVHRVIMRPSESGAVPTGAPVKLMHAPMRAA